MFAVREYLVVYCNAKSYPCLDKKDVQLIRSPLFHSSRELVKDHKNAIC